MMKEILGVLLLSIVGFLGVVSKKEGHFRYERSGLIAAPASAIYPVISQL